MEKLREKGRGQQIMLIIQLLMLLIFIPLFMTVGKQSVLSWHNGWMRAENVGDSVVYSGRGEHKGKSFTVTGDTVEYRLEGELIHTYTVAEAPDAIPDNKSLNITGSGSKLMKGFEISRDGESIMRGAYIPNSVSYYHPETGGIETYKNYEAPEEAKGIFHMLVMQETEPRGNLQIFAMAIFICIVNALSIYFVDELFRFNLSFAIKNAERAEPSDWELFTRWVGWVLLSGTALASFIVSIWGARSA